MKLTTTDRNRIIQNYAVGKSAQEITEEINRDRPKKLRVSRQAVSKILYEFKSGKVASKVAESSEKLPKSGESKIQRSHREVADKLVGMALESLESRPFDDLSPETLIKIIDRLTAVNFGCQDTSKTELKAIVDQIKEVTGENNVK